MSAPEAAAAPALGGAVRRGVSWMMLTAAIGKVAAFAAQWVLGWLLLEEDFGLYAIFLGVATIVLAFRDGGARSLLVQRGAKGYADLMGPLFWMVLVINTLAALGLIALAPLAAWVYGEPDLITLILILAASFVLTTPSAILTCKLQIDLNFAVYSRIIIYSGLLRNGSTVLMAYMGFGAASFVWPWLFCAAFESLYAYLATRHAPWRHSAQIRRWPALFRQTKWLIFGSFSNLVLDMGSYLVVGLVLSTAITGVYYFAFQITAQVAVLLSHSLASVLLPALVTIKDEPERMREAIARTTRTIMFLSCPACVLLSVTIEPLERLLWQGRWDAAVLAVLVLGVFFPMRITFGITLAVLTARGDFKLWSLLTMAEGVLISFGAWVGAYFGGTPWHICWGVGVAMCFSRFLITAYTLDLVGIPLRERLGAIVPAWFVSVAAGAAVVAMDWELGLSARLASLVHSVPWLRTLLGERTWMAGELIRLTIVGGVFCLLYAVMARTLLVHQLTEVVRSAPQRFRSFAGRALALR